MIKKAKKKNLFHFKVWYERLFVITPDQLQILKKSQERTTIAPSELLHIDRISRESDKTNCPFKYWFFLTTKTREFQLFAPNMLEREIWIKSFRRLLRVPIKNTDSDFEDISDDEDLLMRYLKMQKLEIDEQILQNRKE